jgi:CBS domain-containing protein
MESIRGWDMPRQDSLSSLLSVHIRIHPTLFFVPILITAILVTQYPGYYPLYERILLGLFGSLLFLAVVIIIGVLTNLAAILAHIPVRNTMFFFFGEVIIVPEDGLRPEHEVIIALFTLLLYLVVAIIFNGLYLVQSHAISSPFVLLLQWLAFFWYILTLMHIIPVFPLACGRLVVAGLWKWRWKYLKVLRFSAMIAFGLGICLALGGLALILQSGGHSTNGWLFIFLGWSLQGGAAFSLRRTALLGLLNHTTAANVMTQDFTIISPDQKIGDLVRNRILVTGQDYFAVNEGSELLGILTVQDIKRVARKRWDSTQVKAVMRTGHNLKTVRGEENTSHVIEQMDQLRADRIPVIQGNTITGVVTRAGISRLVKTRARLKI